MARRYERQYLPDGTPNPKHKSRAHGKRARYAARGDGAADAKKARERSRWQRRKERAGARKRSGKALTRFERGRFLAFDGEGVTAKSGTHRYIMLCCSNGATLHAAPRRGLSTLDCLQFLYEQCMTDRGAIPVMFGASYDVNMILGDIPRGMIRRLWQGESVRWKKWQLQYRHRKTLSITPAPVQYKKVGEKWIKQSKSVTLWDTFGFFQATFVEALTQYLGNDYPDLEMIRQQKAQRGKFRERDRAEIARYCIAECHALVALMKRLRDYLAHAELPVSRWDGAGAVAASLLQRQGIKAHKSEACALPPPDVIERWARYAYAGGRIELIRYGHIPGPIYHYDIRSAYPAAMLKCPSLATGVWRREIGPLHRPFAHDEFTLCHVSWDFTRRKGAVYPFFWRDASANIFFPPRGEGWYWAPEVSAAHDMINAGALHGRMIVHEAWRFENISGIYPFDWIGPLFQQRAEWKAAGIGAEKAVKLGINSLYGKTAQHLGGTAERRPAYHQLEWAGFITSYTRAQLFRNMAPIAGRAGIMMATDALYSLRPLDVPCGDALGEWEATTHDAVTVVQSGVYWTIDGANEKMYCRGFDKGSLHRAKILRAWKRGARTHTATLTRFVGMGSALAGGTSWQHWRTWRTMPRLLSLVMDGTKRADPPGRDALAPNAVPVRTNAAEPFSQHFDMCSRPYPLPWELGSSDQIVDGAPARVVMAEAYDAEL